MQLYASFIGPVKRRCQRLHQFPRTLERRSGSCDSALANLTTVHHRVRVLSGGAVRLILFQAVDSDRVHSEHASGARSLRGPRTSARVCAHPGRCWTDRPVANLSIGG